MSASAVFTAEILKSARLWPSKICANIEKKGKMAFLDRRQLNLAFCGGLFLHFCSKNLNNLVALMINSAQNF